MPPLAELQQNFVQAIMNRVAPVGMFGGAVPPGHALAVHRGTILGALVNALRLSYPTVDMLVGAEFFDHAAETFAEKNLPQAACLSNYGEGFADFLAGFAPAAALAYLPDVARLDRAVEAALRSPMLMRRYMLDAGVSIDLPHSLCVLSLMHAADEIRAGLGDDAALAAIDTGASQRFILVWRKGFDAAVQRVDDATGRFLIALLANEGADAAFRAAVTRTDEAQALQIIQAEIFAASFCTVISTTKELLP